jgi:HEAT repeat protein
VRAAGADDLAEWPGHADRVVPRLVALLEDPDEDVSDLARQGLLNLSEHSAAAKFVQAAIPGLPPRRASWFVAAAYGDDVPALAAVAPRLLATGDPDLRTATLRALNELPATSVDASILVPLLDDSSPAVRAEAAFMLWWSGTAAGARSVAVASAVAADADDDVRRTAARVLASAAGTRDLSPELLALLADPSDKVRSAAYAELAIKSDPLGVPSAVLDAVIDNALRTRNHDAVLVALRIENGVEALVRAAAVALQSEDVDLVRSALDALGTAGPAARSACASLAPLTQDGRFASEARTAYFEITGEVSALDDSYELDELHARRLLSHGDAGADSVVRRAAHVAGWYRVGLCAALGEDASLCAAVLRGAQSRGDDWESERPRVGAAGLAPVLAPSRAIELLATLSRDPSARVRVATAESLASLGDGLVDLTAATEALGRLLDDEDSAVRREAVLAARHVSELRPAVRARLHDSDACVRLQAGAALCVDSADESAGRAIVEALARAKDDTRLADANWRVIDTALARMPLLPADAPTFALALIELDDCSCQGPILRALKRLGPAASPALAGVRAALAGDLSCRHGIHVEVPNGADAIAALAAMGAAARPAIPDLTTLAARSPEFATSARAAISAITAEVR